MQNRAKNIIFNICILFCGLLLVLLFSGGQLKTHGFLQVVGRMHPLMLHFPIVLLLVAFVWEFATARSQHMILTNAGDWFLLTAAFTSLLSSLMGLFLSQEEGYEEAGLSLHKWAGVAVSLLAVLWYAFRQVLRRKRNILFVAGCCGIAGIVIAGHQGARITHGEDFLFPLQAEKEKQAAVPLEEAIAFTHLVKPILTEKCIGCHNSAKAKGNLVMETEALLLKGGKNGKLWDSAAAGFGLLMQRIHLPLKEKKHMPPKGKPQLTGEEIAVLYHWIKSGASFTKKVTEYEESDTLRMLAGHFLSAPETATYSFPAADESLVKKLNTDYRVIQPLSAGSPALSVAFYGARFFMPAHLKELKPVKEQVVSLHLANMPLKDEDVETIAQFKNLESLNISFTGVTGKGLALLAKLPGLKQVSLAGLQLNTTEAEMLKNNPKLSAVYVWNTSLTERDIQALSRKMPGVVFNNGFKGDTITASLNAPLIEGTEQLFTDSLQVKLKHYIKGAVLRYTIDGSEPDSLLSPVYKNYLTIAQSGTLKVKAFLPGWISSPVATRQFYKTGYLADSIQLVKAPHANYKGEGGKTLINREKGEMDFRNGKWLGYKDSDMEAILYFKNPVPVSSVSFSTLVDIGSYIMPAYQLEVWGGSALSNLKLLKRINPKQPAEQIPVYLMGFDCRFTTTTVNVVKIIAKPLPKLPSWHPGKGTPAWVFIDEIFLN